MMAEEFLELMSEVDDELLEKSERSKNSMKKKASWTWLRAGALAACVCLVAAVGFELWQRYGSTYTENIGGSETENVTTETEAETTPVIKVELSEGRSYGLSSIAVDEESWYYSDPIYIREDAEPTRTVTLLGKTATVKYVETYKWAGSDLQDDYEDEKGNSYTFAEDGTFLSYIGESELEGFSPALYVDKGIAPDITEDEAVAIAEKTAKEVYGEAFDKVKLESVKYKYGKYDVEFHQRLGADGSLLGLSCHVSVLANGTPYFYTMGGLSSLRDLDESKYENITKEKVEKIAIEQYGVDAELFPSQDYIQICKKDGKLVLHVMSQMRTPGTADIYFEVTDVTDE